MRQFLKVLVHTSAKKKENKVTCRKLYRFIKQTKQNYMKNKI